MSPVGTARLALRLLRAEGPGSLLERLRARAAHRRSLRAHAPASEAELRAAGVAVLVVLPSSRDPQLGGVQVQLQARLAAEAARRPVALLFAEGPAWRLECHAGARRGFRECGSRSEGLGAALGRAVALLGPRGVHVESLAALGADGLLHPEEVVAQLAAWRARPGGPALVVSLHDYAFHCPRQFLIECPQDRFCGFSRDLSRCRRCLEPVPPASAGLPGLRDGARRLLAGADALVCPSSYVKARLAELVPEARPAEVIPPGMTTRAPAASDRAPAWPPRLAAVVGATRLEKGARVAAELVPLLRAQGLEVEAWGRAGELDALLALRRAGARVRGAYAPGSLPERLRRAGADVAVVPSIGPETYGLAVDECRAAGLPVVLFDVGAPPERVRARGGGTLVPLEAGAAGLAAAVAELAKGPAPAAGAWRLPTSDEAARAHLALYARLGLLEDRGAPQGRC